MIKEILWIITLFSTSCLVFATSHVVISEVLYDPTTTETGGEFIELYNPTPFPVNLSGWVIATKTSKKDAILPNTAYIKPYGFYLVADKGWGSTKKEEWPNADYEEAITLSATNSGVALIRDDTVIDAVGWGSPKIIDNMLFEGTPANYVSEGFSLERKPAFTSEFSGNGIDTDNNTNCLLYTSPSPRD